MSKTVVQGHRVRFGVFEADLRSGELRKFGMRIRLQTLPFKILAVLLEHAGDVVSKEELQERIWGDSVVVDFDHSLGTAINKIRDALGDSADSPRYVETLARRGYRFIAPVEVIEPIGIQGEAKPNAPANPTNSLADEGIRSATTQREFEPAFSTSAIRKRRILWISIGAVFLLVSAGLLFWIGQRNTTLPSSIVHIAEITSSDRVYPGDISIESLSSIVTDGTRIYFPEIRDGRLVLVHASLADGTGYPLEIPSEVVRPSLAAISSDGSRFLVQSHQWSKVEEPMWLVPVNGGAAARVGGILGHDGTFTPDGKSILYASGNDLYLATLNGANSRKLASLPGRAFWLRYSPDGTVIRLTILHPVTRATSLWEISADGTNLRSLLPNWSTPTSECCGSWTADGKYFIFQSGHTGRSNLWALKSSYRFTSDAPVPITDGPVEYLEPVASKDPNRVYAIGARYRSYLSAYDSGSKRFGSYLSGLGSAGRVELSRDGEQVAWVNTSDGSLWQSRLDGTQRLQLTSPPMRVFMMRWSPDGKKIAFMGKKPGSPWKIYLVPKDGGNIEAILDEPSTQADPCWTSDGTGMIFGRAPVYMGEDSTPKAIYYLDLKTKHVSTIPDSAGLFSPRLSRDGRYLVAMPLDQQKLVFYDFATKRWSDLIQKGANNPVWSSDGKSIYFQAFMEPGQPIYRVQVSDHRFERLVDFPNVRPSEAFEYIGLTGNDEPITLTNVWTANIYAISWNQD